MRERPAIASVVGQTSETRWGQVLQLPHAYGVVEVHDEGGHALARGVELLGRVTQLLEHQPTSLAEVEEIVVEVFDDTVETVIILVPVGTVLYVAMRGKGAVYLKRNTQFACLMREGGAISGEVKEGDMILVANTSASESVPQRDLAGMFDHHPPREIAENLSVRLHEQPQAEGAAVLIYQASLADEVFYPDATQTPETDEIRPTWKDRLKDLPIFSFTLRTLFHRVKRKARNIIGRSSNRKMGFAIVITCLFIVSVILGVRKNMTDEKHKALTVAVEEAQAAYSEGVALLSLNQLKSREKLLEAREALTPFADADLPPGKEVKRMEDLLVEIDKGLELALQIVRWEPELFFDAELVKKGASVTYMDLAGESLVMADGNLQSLFTVHITSKRSDILAGGAVLGDTVGVAASETTIFIVTKNGIHTVDRSSQQTQERAIPASDQWGTLISPVTYGGNVYAVDTYYSRIWKYTPTTAGQYSDLREYLNPDTLPDLRSVTSMAIDGEVWLGTNQGNIMRFVGGKTESFSPQGVDPAFGNELIVYTNDEMQLLYVLDVQNNRVVVLEKQGLYVAQYVWEALQQPTDLVVSEKHGTILLLSQGKIYSIPLRQ